MDLRSPSGFFAKRFSAFTSAVGPLVSYPYQALLGRGISRPAPLEYHQLGETRRVVEVLEYPEDSTMPAYAVNAVETQRCEAKI